MPSINDTTENIRSNFSAFTIILAFVLSIMVIDTHRKCKVSKENKKIYNQSTELSIIVASIVLILTSLLILFDLSKLLK